MQGRLDVENSANTGCRIGDATAPVGGGRGIDGVLSLYLKENARKIDEARMQRIKLQPDWSLSCKHVLVTCTCFMK